MKQAVESLDFQQMEKSLSKFNVFDVLRCADHEIRHSNILAWLLDPVESHGMGGHFLATFLENLRTGSGDEEKRPFEKMAREDFQSVTIHRETRYNIDILLELTTKRDGIWVVCIENKFKAKQGKEQLKRYRETIEKVYPHARQTFVFLTLREEKPHDGAYFVISYEQVSRELQKVLNSRSASIAAQPRMLIEHYQSILAERLDQNSKSARLARNIAARHPQAVQLAQSIVEPAASEGKNTPLKSPTSRDRTIYDDHKRAFDYILKHRPNRTTDISALLTARMKAEGRNHGWKPAGSKERITFFIPREWDKLASESNGDRPRIFCAIHLAEDKPRLRFVVGPGAPQAWKEKLAQRSQTWNLPGEATAGRHKGGIYAFYYEPLSDTRETPSIEEAAAKIWREVVGVLSRRDIIGMLKDVAHSLR